MNAIRTGGRWNATIAPQNDMMSRRKDFRMKRHLLVASPFHVIADRIARSFSHGGYWVGTVEGGVDCVAEIERLPPDVVVLDRDIPWGGGAGGLADLHDSVMTNRFPVILLDEGFSSGTNFDSSVARCLQTPCDVRDIDLAADTLLASCHRKTKSATIIES
jgi:DNA-binding response OmpR family regulator